MIGNVNDPTWFVFLTSRPYELETQEIAPNCTQLRIISTSHNRIEQDVEGIGTNHLVYYLQWHDFLWP